MLGKALPYATNSSEYILVLSGEEGDNKRYADESTRKADAAFFSSRDQARASQPHSSQAAQRKKNVTCTFCGRRGNVEESCWDKERESGETETKMARFKATQASKAPEQWSGEYAFRAVPFSRQPRQSKLWHADSGASQHMTDQRWAFTTFRPIESGVWPVNGIGKKRLQVRGLGTVRVRGEVDKVVLKGVLQEVLYVPKLGANLFSVSSATRNGYEVSFSGDGVKVLKNAKVLAVGSRGNSNLYVFNLYRNAQQLRNQWSLLLTLQNPNPPLLRSGIVVWVMCVWPQ